MATDSTKRGLNGGLRVFPNESRQELDDLIAQYRGIFAPTDVHQEFMVQEIVQSRWRLARIRRIEAAVIAEMSGSGAPDIDKAINALTNLKRLAMAAQQTSSRVLKQFQLMRKVLARAASEPAVQNEPNPEAPGSYSEDWGWKM